MSDEPWWWLGLTPSERTAITTTPSWAEFVEAALRLAPQTGRRPAPGLPWADAFGLILSPFAELAFQGQHSGAILTAATAQLTHELTRLAARTLVLELNVARRTGRLSGDDPAQRFACFVGLAGGREALRGLCTEYAVLARLLGQRCLNAAEALTELLDRYAEDRQEIVDVLLGGADPGPLVAVRTAAGDPHRRGRSVAILSFANGSRVVYKPRPVSVHRHFHDIVEWFTARLRGPGLRTTRLLERNGFGWVEFVEAAPCADRAQVERFYHRQGALLALLHALGGTDIHYENLIACGEHPVLIDIETLFQPGFPVVPPTGSDPAALVLAASVHRITLLPRLLLGEDDAWDLSGLGGDKGTIASIEGITWEGAGTDEMRLVRRPAVSAGAANRPTLGGVDAEPADFTAALIAGFRDGYAAILGGRAELVSADGPLQRFAEDDVRVIARATRTYAALLRESTHPDVLREATRYAGLLDLLRTGDSAPLADAEIADLWAGDVPFFHARPTTVDVWDSRGRRITRVLARTGLSAAVATIKAMGRKDRARQEWIIRAALASRSAGVHEKAATGCPRDEVPARDRLLGVAERAARWIAANGCRDGRRVNWLGLEPAGERLWHLGPLGATLGTGYCGLALFLAQLDQVRGTDEYRRLIHESLSPIPGLLAGLAEVPEHLGAVGSGAFAGLGGIAYALTRIAVALDDSEIAAWARWAVALTAEAVAADTETGVIDGTAGGLAALLAVQRITGSPVAGVGKAADELLARPLPEPAGFGHGAAGVGWALLRFGDYGYAKGLEILRSVRPRGPSWCSGLTGLALAVAGGPAAHEPCLADVVDRATAELRVHGALGDDSLCHGEFGALALLARTAERRSSSAMTLDVRCGTPHGLTSPGILTGVSGIGHGALHFGFPEQVPSVLLLE